jgi:hypothetical protein
MFLTKYSADGIVQWTRLRGTSQDDSVFSVSAGRESACIAGSTAGALDTAYGGIDAVIASYSLDGMLLWTRQFGTAETDRATAVAVSTVGIVAAGFTAGGFAPAVNAGSSDIFVAEYDLDGNRRVLRQIGTPAPDSAQGAAVAGSGFHVAGYTGGNLNGVAGLGREDLFLMRFTTGTVPLLLWTQESGYSEGGLQPTDSAGTGTYVYRVAYRQSEGIAPLAGYPKLHVLQDGAETAGSPFTMAEVTPGATNYATGVIFTYSLTLPEGSYRYYFEAYDQFNNPAAGAPTARLEGPTYRPPEAQNIKAYHGVFKPGDGETCTLAYTLDRPGEIGVAVYDSLGGKVKDLFRNTVAAGVNTVVWDGKNTAGDLVASGVYVFRIDPGGKKLKKIVVVR